MCILGANYSNQKNVFFFSFLNMTVCIRSKSYGSLTLGIVVMSYVNSVCYEIDNRYFTLVENYFFKRGGIHCFKCSFSWCHAILSAHRVEFSRPNAVRSLILVEHILLILSIIQGTKIS